MWPFSTPDFTPDKDIPDLSGKVVLVTGGNSGLGRETVLQLSKHKPHIFLAARSKAKAETAIEEIKAAVPDAGPISFLELDLSSFDSIKAAAQSLRASTTRLDILVNNAGIMATPEGLTKDGYEIQFGTNHMGPALLTKLLLPLMKQTAATQDSDVRVVFITSALESQAPKDSYQFDKLKTTLPGYASWTKYGLSKLATNHYAMALAQRNPDIKVITVHPGVVQTNLMNPFFEGFHPVLARALGFATKLSGVSVEKGALTQLWAATSPEAKSGTWYVPVGKVTVGSKLSQDGKLGEQLFEWTEKELASHVV
jgi:NAD(P)-dependent dehydrogenase (short-subunit alcohol dehydrogenase family)